MVTSFSAPIRSGRRAASTGRIAAGSPGVRTGRMERALEHFQVRALTLSRSPEPIFDFWAAVHDNLGNQGSLSAPAAVQPSDGRLPLNCQKDKAALPIAPPHVSVATQNSVFTVERRSMKSSSRSFRSFNCQSTSKGWVAKSNRDRLHRSHIAE
jgi:hypothetical protein